MKSLLKTILIFFIVVFFSGATFLGYHYYLYTNALTKGYNPSLGESEFIIEPGESFLSIANRLEMRGFIKNSLYFRIAGKAQGFDTEVEAGSFVVSGAMSMQEILNTLLDAENTAVKIIRIQDAWRIEDVATYLSEQDVGSYDDFLNIFENPDEFGLTDEYEFLSSSERFGFTRDMSLEGYLFPDTYEIHLDATPIEITKKMLDNFNLKYSTSLAGYIDNSEYSLHELVTLASIVDREAFEPEEQRMVAGIFLNRLDLGIPLGSDVTVLYILGDWGAEITYQDLQIDSPYNTRLNPGLPPGPIISPSLSPLEAVLDPTESDYFYFVVGCDERMHYGETNADHEYNKSTYGVLGLCE